MAKARPRYSPPDGEPAVPANVVEGIRARLDELHAIPLPAEPYGPFREALANALSALNVARALDLGGRGR